MSKTSKTQGMIISCVDVSSKEGKAFKTILVNLELLYSILELRRRTVNDADEGDEGDEEGDVSGGIKFKSQKKLGDDASLHKACIEYLEKRLNIGTDPVDWPHFFFVSVACFMMDAPSLRNLLARKTSLLAYRKRSMQEFLDQKVGDR